jgi:hypothetical protein
MEKASWVSAVPGSTDSCPEIIYPKDTTGGFIVVKYYRRYLRIIATTNIQSGLDKEKKCVKREF